MDSIIYIVRITESKRDEAGEYSEREILRQEMDGVYGPEGVRRLISRINGPDREDDQ